MNIDTKPLVSVITPAYNSERFIGETIDSVLAQTLEDWEMIIVDDCSTDRTFEIIKRYAAKEPRIKARRLSENSGAAIARNEAIRQSRGRYIAFLDSDDQWFPEKLEVQLDFMKENNAIFTFTNYCYVNEQGEGTGKVSSTPSSVNYTDLLKQNMIGCLTVMIDKNKAGPIEMVNIRTRQDYVLWLSLCKKGIRAQGLSQVLSKYRVVQNSVSSDKYKMAKQNWRVYRKIEKLSLLKSVWYFANYIFFKVKKYSTL